MIVVAKVGVVALLVAVVAVLEAAEPHFYENTLNLQSNRSDLKQTKATS